MRTAVNQFMAPALSLDDVAATARELGVAGVGVFRPCLADLGAATVRSVLAREGLVPTSVCVLLGLTGTSSDERAARLADAGRAVRDASALGAPLVIIAGGSQGRPRDDVLAEFADQLSAVADLAAEHGVRLLLEPLHPDLAAMSVVTSLREACRIAATHRDFGVVLDTWHVGAEPGLLDTAEVFAADIDVVHLAGRRSEPHTERRALPGTDGQDLAALYDVLPGAWWEVEVLDEAVTDPGDQRQLLRDAVGAIHSLHRKERTCASRSSVARPAARAH